MNFTKKTRVILIGIVAISIIGTAAFFRFHRNDSEKTEKLLELTKDATEFDGLEIKVPSSDENAYWQLNLAKLTSFTGVGQMSKISGQYILNNKPVQFITADTGDIHWKDRRVSFKGNVQFRTDDNKKLFADVLIWEPQQEVIQAKGHVKLQSDSISVQTEQLTTSSDFKKVEFSGMTRVFSQR